MDSYPAQVIGALLGDQGAPRSAAVRRAYAADIDEYRARFGKAEGERRFFADHAEIPGDTAAGQDAPADDGAPFEFDEIGPFDSVYIDCTPGF